MKNTFLFVSIDGITDPLGQSQILPYLIELSKKGHSIGIASVEKQDNFEKNRVVVKELCNKHKIDWHYVFYDTKIPLYSQYKNYKNLKQIVSKQIQNNSSTVLHCRSYLPALIGLYFKKKANIPFIFDMRGFWADERIEGNIWSLSNPVHRRLYHFFKKKEKELFIHSNQIVSLTHKAKEIILSWKLGFSSDKINVIPCCADLTHFSRNNINPEKLETLKKELSISEEFFVLNYNGSLGTWYMIDEMMCFFKELLNVKPAIFLIITKDSPEIAYSAAHKSGVDKSKIIVRSATRSEMPYYIALSTASLFFIRPTFSKNASSPTKMGELLSMQVPIVTNKGIGDVDNIILSEKCGVLIDSFNNNAYRVTAKELLDSFSVLKTNSEGVAQKYFDLKMGTETYNQIYLSLNKITIHG